MQISNLINSFELEITRKGYRKESIKNYVSCVTKFLYHFKEKDSAKHINESDIKVFLSQFKEHNTQRGYHSAIKCFYKYEVRQPNKFRFIEYCKRDRKLPIVHSQEEIQKIIDACDNLKHKSIICTIYACGLRVGELINLKITDIDSSRMIINIRDAKGGRDRQVMLPQSLLELLRKYFLEYRPKDFLFNGQNDSPKYSDRSIAQFLNTYSKKAGLNKRIYPHLLRHDSFTHLLESGCDLSIIQRLAGHQNIRTTQGYCHISNNLISKINSPINNIRI